MSTLIALLVILLAIPPTPAPSAVTPSPALVPPTPAPSVMQPIPSPAPDHVTDLVATDPDVGDAIWTDVGREDVNIISIRHGPNTLTLFRIDGEWTGMGLTPDGDSVEDYLEAFWSVHVVAVSWLTPQQFTFVGENIGLSPPEWMLSVAYAPNLGDISRETLQARILVLGDRVGPGYYAAAITTPPTANIPLYIIPREDYNNLFAALRVMLEAPNGGPAS